MTTREQRAGRSILPTSSRWRVAWAVGMAAVLVACSDETVERDGGAGAAGAGGSVSSLGYCGDGACVLTEGENRVLCPEDCGPAGTGSAEVQFFADFDSKAVEPDQVVRFVYVVWNDGPVIAENVVLPVPIVQDETTTIYGDREHCGSPAERYDCMVDLSYVPGSMRVNRVYHPNRARNSYAFVDMLPLTDEADDDEARFDAERKLLFLTIPELRPRSVEPEVAGYLWSYELRTDGAQAHTPCENHPLVQNWNWIFADNSPEYMNDIIGHIYCASPRLHGTVAADKTTAAPGESIVYQVTLAYDDVVPPEDIDVSRFSLARPRLYFDYPENLLEILAVDKPDEATDLPDLDDSPSAGGVVYWERTDDAGETAMAAGETEMLVVTARVRDGVPTGSELTVRAKVLSQNTRPYQNDDGELLVTVTAGATPSCGDGFCSPDEDCADDCPTCTPEDGVSSLDSPPCCDGLTLVRGSQLYEWAYEQCYDWYGGGVPFVQGYCTACGDGQCTGRENACNCAEDCGPHCGNWTCEAGEDRQSCPADC